MINNGDDSLGHRLCLLFNAHFEDVLHLKKISTKLMRSTFFYKLLLYIKGAEKDMTIR